MSLSEYIKKLSEISEDRSRLEREEKDTLRKMRRFVDGTTQKEISIAIGAALGKTQPELAEVHQCSQATISRKLAKTVPYFLNQLAENEAKIKKDMQPIYDDNHPSEDFK